MPEALRTTRLRGIEGRLVPYAWPWARDNADKIAAHWERRRAARPAMFDGIVLLSCACTVEGGIARVDLFEARFSQFVGLSRRRGLRRHGRQRLRGHRALERGRGGAGGRDGRPHRQCRPALLPLRHPRPGRPAGRDGRSRGQREAGIRRGDRPVGARGRRRRVDPPRRGGAARLPAPRALPRDADILLARAEAHRRAEADPELAALRLLRGPADLDPQRMPGFVRAYLAQAFG